VILYGLPVVEDFSPLTIGGDHAHALFALHSASSSSAHPAGLAAANAATGARIASAMIVFLMFSCCSPKFAGLTSWQGWRFRRTPQGRTLTPRRTHRHGPPVSRRLDQHRVTLPNHKPTQATRLGTPALTRSRSPGTRRPQHASRLSVLPSVRLLELL